ncbi:hypothetical protein [Desulfuromonas acetoxidans]|uniref:hypothetical protein n=1 Tax=Desulfuromonas acetoxidans TaxID=891 RepID=UPI00068117A9|nr:hypothetical protein [Desulfuromonas acetoxidans]MBF0645039.1 hypothetical protein [Desulfuromonas acetoxidans]NVD23151.1 hypothetical protein [Desulfuromonas acetoxidans]NVE15608.1 hypothetical protein [Desulfuromonas acetoxidans]
MKTELITENYILHKEVVEQQIDVLYAFTRSLAYYRSIHQDLEKLEENYDFFCHTMNAHILKAITLWCMVFGPDKNEIQWKKTCLTGKDKFEKEIRNLICESTNFRSEEWAEYHEEMRLFRNKYVAHRDPKFRAPVPHLENAFKIATAFFEWIKKQLWPSYGEPEPLNVLYPKFETEAILAYRALFKEI